jgi:hypothetical protein
MCISEFSSEAQSYVDRERLLKNILEKADDKKDKQGKRRASFCTIDEVLRLVQAVSLMMPNAWYFGKVGISSCILFKH